jgi:hypothetical protein
MRRIHSGLELAEEEQSDDLELETKDSRPALERPRSRPESVKNRVLKPDLEVPEEEEEEEEEVSDKDRHNSISLLSSPIELDMGNQRKGSRNSNISSVSAARSELLPSAVQSQQSPLNNVSPNEMPQPDFPNHELKTNSAVNMATTKNSSWWLESSVGKDEVVQDSIIPLEQRNQGQSGGSGGGDLWFHSSVSTDV